MKHRYATALIAALVLAGCANQPTNEEEVVKKTLDEQIMDAAKQIQAAQAELYSAGAIGQPTPKLPNNIAEGDLITLTWQGDALQLMEHLAKERGLMFTVLGVRLPMPVNIDVKDATWDDLMKLVKAQIGYRANITEFDGQMALQYNLPRP